MDKKFKKKHLFFLLILIHNFSFCSEFTFPIKFGIGTQFSSTGEYIYSSDDKYIASYLEWVEKCSTNLYLGTNLNIKNFIINFDVKYFLPLDCGKMYDSDWNSKGIKHTYSYFDDNFINLGISTDLLFGYQKRISNSIYTNFLLGINYDFISFEAKNGIGRFGSYEYTGKDDIWWYETDKKYKVSTINYYRHTLNLLSGFELNILFNKNKLNFGIITSPFTFISSMDTHNDDTNSGLDYKIQAKQFSSFCYYNFFINYNFALNNTCEIYIDNSFSIITLIKGKISTTYMFDLWHILSQKSGSDEYKYNVSIGLIYKI